MVKVATVDKWKLKQWFEIIAPALFHEQSLGETFANDSRLLVGRVVEKALSDLTGDSKMQRIKLIFKITDVKGERALTKYLGHAITQDYERSIGRRRSSKIYSNQVVLTKDGKKVVIKSFIVASSTVKPSLKSDLRKKAVAAIFEFAKGENFNDFVSSVLYGKLSAHVKKELHKLYPVKYAVMQKSHVAEEGEAPLVAQ